MNIISITTALLPELCTGRRRSRRAKHEPNIEEAEHVEAVQGRSKEDFKWSQE